ncbi:hypothetical protein E2C01_085011 [Portunus trituberculatus]|uniref:Uncharacterized protein n=1 Tax=Portunus trituberculatus TaxID=210409 RepID=A0A5B7JCE6_PORTR|nr:hypothetical protein [Portunus trituberculatus]
MKLRPDCTNAIRSASVITFGTGDSSSTSSLAANFCCCSTKSSVLRSSVWDWTSSAMLSTLMASSPSADKRAELASSTISWCRSSWWGIGVEKSETEAANTSTRSARDRGGEPANHSEAAGFGPSHGKFKPRKFAKTDVVVRYADFLV